MTSARPDAATGDRLPVLDGVRGLAILLILVFHFAVLSGTQGTGLDEAFARVTSAGWVGVDLFFVLSGFLITGILYDSKASVTAYFRNFYARRTLRVFPAYYLLLVLLVVVLPLVVPAERELAGAVRDNIGWYATYTTNLDFSSEALDRPDFVLTAHLWSLAVEEQFYLIWPAFVLLFSRRRLMAICGLLILGSLALRTTLDLQGVHREVAHDLMPAHMDAFGAGGLIALAFRQPADLRALRRWAWPAVGAGGAVVVALFASLHRFSPDQIWVQTIGYTALAVLFGAIILLAITSSPGSGTHYVWTRRVMTQLGKYSYAMYLLHWPVGSLLAKHADITGSVSEVAGSTWPGALLYMAAAMGLTLGLAIVSWYLWEQPFLRLKNRFPYRPLPAPQRAPEPHVAGPEAAALS